MDHLIFFVQTSWVLLVWWVLLNTVVFSQYVVETQSGFGCLFISFHACLLVNFTNWQESCLHLCAQDTFHNDYCCCVCMKNCFTSLPTPKPLQEIGKSLEAQMFSPPHYNLIHLSFYFFNLLAASFSKCCRWKVEWPGRNVHKFLNMLIKCELIVQIDNNAPALTSQLLISHCCQLVPDSSSLFKQEFHALTSMGGAAMSPFCMTY